MWLDMLLTPSAKGFYGISIKPYKSTNETSLWSSSVLKLIKILMVDLQSDLANAGTDAMKVSRVFDHGISILEKVYGASGLSESQKKECIKSATINSVTKGEDGRIKISVTLTDGFGKPHFTDGIEVVI